MHIDPKRESSCIVCKLIILISNRLCVILYYKALIINPLISKLVFLNQTDTFPDIFYLFTNFCHFGKNLSSQN